LRTAFEHRTRRSTKVQWPCRVSGDSELQVPILNSAAHGRLRMHGPPTSTFALAEVWAASEPTEPPPPKKYQVSALPDGRALLYPASHPYSNPYISTAED
jgi:hypothetical protein